MTAGMPELRYRAVVFDLDGTLIDSYDAIAASVNHVRALHKLPPWTTAEVRRVVGRGAEYLMRHAIPVGEVGENLAAYKKHHPYVMQALTQVLPDVAATLARLHAAGFTLAVCSNKPVGFSRELLTGLGLGNLFALTVGPEDAPRPKPAPDMLLEVIKRLGLAPDGVLYVGDMVVDIETARAAGVTVWVVPTGSEDSAALRRAHPDRFLDSFAELQALAGASART
jgi:2-phosphoglycolate phosphatase